jgi:hypothetical protein
MATSYLNLTNKLRSRFNEPHITAATWATVVGFDQYCKDAINYAYHDILNAEMEWPFLHRAGQFLTSPGTQFYSVTTADEYTIKEVDWDSFYIEPNTVNTTYTSELKLIPATAPYTRTPTNSTFSSDLGVTYLATGIEFQSVDHDPQATGEYTIKDGVYYFYSGDANTLIRINYTTVDLSTVNVLPAQHLPYIDYDHWRQVYLNTDYSAAANNGFSQPRFVFKTQVYGQVGLTPVPAIISSVNFEYWIDADDLVNTSDVTLLPVRYEQVLLDGAAKYCYEFREDTPLAKSAEERFQRGIMRMRTELINRSMDARAGFNWRHKYYGGFFS